MLLSFAAPVSADRLELLVSAEAAYDVTLLSHGEPVLWLTAKMTWKAPVGLQWRCLYFNTATFDAVRIKPRASRPVSKVPAALTVGRITAWTSID